MDSLPGPYGLVLSNIVLNSIMHAFPDGKQGTDPFNAQDRPGVTRSRSCFPMTAAGWPANPAPGVRSVFHDPAPRRRDRSWPSHRAQHGGGSARGPNVAHQRTRRGNKRQTDSATIVGDAIPQPRRFSFMCAAVHKLCDKFCDRSHAAERDTLPDRHAPRQGSRTPGAMRGGEDAPKIEEAPVREPEPLIRRTRSKCSDQYLAVTGAPQLNR